MEETLYTRWFNWRWRPANIWGRHRLRRLPTMTPPRTPLEIISREQLEALEAAGWEISRPLQHIDGDGRGPS